MKRWRTSSRKRDAFAYARDGRAPRTVRAWLCGHVVRSPWSVFRDPKSGAASRIEDPETKVGDTK
ncbi:MAG: hypothetical protein QOG67_255 [Verrucomicrobiota bacterium]|jgi:hypothetical protein